MANKLAILVVEDEAAICTGLCDVLAFHGHLPTAVASGEDALREALSGRFALVLLDVMLPGVSGFDVCRRLRQQHPEQAILMLTARGAETDVLEGFRCGADDYVTKPFSVAELMARVDALLRRVGALAPETAPPLEAFDFNGWRVDPVTRLAAGVQGSIALTPREVALLALFVRERGRIVSRRALLVEIWGLRHPEEIHTRTVDMHIAKLRKKIASPTASPSDRRGSTLNASPQHSGIETVRGEGYRFSG